MQNALRHGYPCKQNRLRLVSESYSKQSFEECSNPLPMAKKSLEGRDTLPVAMRFATAYVSELPRLWLTSEPIFYLRANKKERFVPSLLCQKERNLNRTVFDLGFFWRRGRDSNPRGFWPNGFQDRLVMTASIPLQIYML